jgi:hypothetical protein
MHLLSHIDASVAAGRTDFIFRKYVKVLTVKILYIYYMPIVLKIN